MGKTAVPDYPRGLTFEQVWAGIHELRESQRESFKETERLIKKSAEETRASLEASAKAAEAARAKAEKAAEVARAKAEAARAKVEKAAEIARVKAEKAAEVARAKAEKASEARYKKFDEALGKFGNTIGLLIEEMVEPNMLKQFAALGFHFSRISRHNKYEDEKQVILEVDLFLEDGDKVVAVEVKSKTSADDVRKHIRRMDKLRSIASSKGDNRKYLGAIGGMIFNRGVKELALKCGFYVIEPSGDTFNVIAPEGPREW